MSRIKINTTHKINHGIISDFWICPEDYRNKLDFLDACRELHEDESHPTIILEACENIPERYIRGNSIDSDLWEWLDLSITEKAAVQCYWDELDYNEGISSILEKFLGDYEDEGDWAYNYLEDIGALQKTPDELHAYINFQDYGQDARRDGCVSFAKHGYRVMAFQRY